MWDEISNFLTHFSVQSLLWEVKSWQMVAVLITALFTMSNDLPLNPTKKKNVSLHVTRFIQCSHRMWSLFCQNLILQIHKIGLIVFIYLYTQGCRQLESNTFLPVVNVIACLLYRKKDVLRAVVGNEDLCCRPGSNANFLWNKTEVSTLYLNEREGWTSTL